MIQALKSSGTMVGDLADIALDPATNDIEIPLRILKGAPCVIQRIRVRFRFFLGEWFLDQRLGVPYFQDILVKSPDPILISAVFRKVLLGTPGVLHVDAFSANLDRLTRVLTVNFQATLVDSTTSITALNEPFILT